MKISKLFSRPLEAKARLLPSFLLTIVSKRKVSLRTLTTFSTLVRFRISSLLMKKVTSRTQFVMLLKRKINALRALHNNCLLISLNVVNKIYTSFSASVQSETR